MKTLFARFANDESGATAIEYGLIATLIAVAIIAGATLVGNQLGTTFGFIADCLDAGCPEAEVPEEPVDP
jgi:pilus assembly protein Flp/PilA